MMENTGGTIEVTGRTEERPTVTVIVQGDELDEEELPDAIDAALSLCSILDSARDIGCHLYDVLNRTFDVVSVEVQW